MTDLEERLRAHYRRSADQLHLPDRQLGEIGGAARTPSVVTRHERHRPMWSAARAGLAVACAVALAVAATVGVLARVNAREDRPPASAPACAAPIEPTSTIASTARDAAPSSTAPRRQPAALPVSTPAGYCVEHYSRSSTDTPQHVTVWASCGDCAEVTAAVEVLDQGRGSGETSSDPPPRVAEPVAIDGRILHLEELPWTGALSLATDDGQQPAFTVFGWGLTSGELEEFAAGLLDGEPARNDLGLELTYDGPRGGLSPGVAAAEDTVQITYATPDQSAEVFYGYQRSRDPIDLNSLLAFAIDARRTTIDGHPAITSETATNATVMLLLDERSMVMLGGNVPLDALLDIRITAAAPDDARWAPLEAAAG